MEAVQGEVHILCSVWTGFILPRCDVSRRSWLLRDLSLPEPKGELAECLTPNLIIISSRYKVIKWDIKDNIIPRLRVNRSSVPNFTLPLTSYFSSFEKIKYFTQAGVFFSRLMDVVYSKIFSSKMNNIFTIYFETCTSCPIMILFFVGSAKHLFVLKQPLF